MIGILFCVVPKFTHLVTYYITVSPLSKECFVKSIKKPTLELVWWLRSVILATWEAEKLMKTGHSYWVQATLGINVRPYSKNN
jgi:hypothetical protein